MKDINQEVKSGPTTVNNALFVGSTAELLAAIKNKKEEDGQDTLQLPEQS